MLRHIERSDGKGTWRVNANSVMASAGRGAGDGVVAHVGLHALGAFADRLGLGGALSARIPPAGEPLPVHDRGKVLVQAMLTMAGGGEVLTWTPELGFRLALSTRPPQRREHPRRTGTTARDRFPGG